MRISVRARTGTGPVAMKDGVVIVHTTEKRKNNLANLDIIKQLSKHYSVPRSSIRIVAGANSSKKILEIIGL